MSVLEGRDRKGLRIPADAVIRSGTKDVVFIALGDGKFSPREVQLGAHNGSEVEVRSGPGGRAGRDARQLPRGLRVPAARLARGHDGEEAMIHRIIRFSAENRYLVIAATLVALLIAVWTMGRIPLDALPDLSDTQVIVYSRWDRSPDIIEDQVTYPIITSLLGAPKVKAIRGFSDFGYSYVYVVFQDGTDHLLGAHARARVPLQISSRLPAGVKTELGPDATSLGWVFQYALVDSSGKHSTDELRSYQDWFLRYAVQSVPGVSEVATVGGQVRQYQITVNPASLAAYGLPLDAVVEAVRHGNNDVGGRLVELSGREYMIRGRGYVKSTQDLEKLVLKTANGTPIQVKDVATVALGPEMRRGIADYNGQGDVVGGIVVMRQGENALNVIERVKAKLVELRPSLPGASRSSPPTIVPSSSGVRSHGSEQDHRGNHHRLADHPAVPLAHPVGDRSDPHDPGERRAGVHPDVSDGAERQPAVDGRHRHFDRRAGGRRNHRGGERLQQDLPLAGRREEGGLPQGPTRGAARGRARRSSSRCWSSPWPSCRSSRWWTRRAACSSRWPTRRTSRWQSPPSWRSPSTRPCGCCSRAASRSRFKPKSLAWLATQVLVGRYYSEEQAPHQPRAAQHLRRAVPVRGPAREGDDPRQRPDRRLRPCRSTCRWARSSCRRCGRARCCTCRRPCSPACRSPRRRRRCRCRTRS